MMEMIETFINGLYVIKFNLFSDERGKLMKPYQDDQLRCIKENITFKEVWFTNSKKDVIRGMHFQMGQLPCEKLVTCVKGKVIDVILDAREQSPTFGKYYSVEISGENGIALFIPSGCAHGYRVLEEDSIMMYMGTEIYSPKDDFGFKWNSFGFDWKIDDPTISERDQVLPSFIPK